jgi:hypothetical protein
VGFTSTTSSASGSDHEPVGAQVLVPRDTAREAVGLVVAWLDRKDDLLDEIVQRYELRGASLDLLMSVLALVAYGGDEEEAAEDFHRPALDLAR